MLVMLVFKSTIVELLQKLKIQYKYFAGTIVLYKFDTLQSPTNSINI